MTPSSRAGPEARPTGKKNSTARSATQLHEGSRPCRFNSRQTVRRSTASSRSGRTSSAMSSLGSTASPSSATAFAARSAARCWEASPAHRLRPAPSTCFARRRASPARTRITSWWRWDGRASAVWCRMAARPRSIPVNSRSTTRRGPTSCCSRTTSSRRFSRSRAMRCRSGSRASKP